jgi:hypothetical protein
MKVDSEGYCQGEKIFNTNVAGNYRLDAGGVLFFSARVPATQVYTKTKLPPTPPPVPEQGTVRISSPAQNQRIPIAWPAFELRFEDNPTHNIDPDGGVKVEWQRFVNGQWVPHPGPPTKVDHWKVSGSGHGVPADAVVAVARVLDRDSGPVSGAAHQALVFCNKSS